MPAPLLAGLRPPAGRRRVALGSVAVLTCLLCSAAPAGAQPASFSPWDGALPAHATAAVSGARAGSGSAARIAPAEDRLGDPGVVADVPSEVKAPPELPAASYLLADLGSGDVLVGKAAHEAHLPASTMKLLTAQTLLPRMDGNLKTRATDSDARVDGTRVGMVPGREYTADQLFHALLMGSANDAAEALARANGGLEQSLKQMSDRAAQLGAKDTVPRSPHGLDAEGQQTSAYDLVAILRGALDTPKVAEILTTQTYPFPKYQPVEQPSSSASASGAETEAPSAAPNGGPSLAGTQQVASQNKLLWNYEGTIGGKDGYTDAAGHTFVGAVRRGDKTYAVAFMGAKSNDWRPMAGLLDWAFANGSKAKAVGKLPGAASPVAAPVAAPAANVATGAEVAPAGGLLAAIVGFFLTVLKVLAWTVAILAVAVVALRVRKLRRDARRRELRRQRLEASMAGVVRPEHPSTRAPYPTEAPAKRPRRPVRAVRTTRTAAPAPRPAKAPQHAAAHAAVPAFAGVAAAPTAASTTSAPSAAGSDEWTVAEDAYQVDSQTASAYQATAYAMTADGTTAYDPSLGDAGDSWGVHRLDQRH